MTDGEGPRPGRDGRASGSDRGIAAEVIADHHSPEQRTRRRLPNRRASETLSFGHHGTDITVTASQYPDGAIGEIFVNAGHANSAIDAIVSDAAIAVSFALQHGADLAAIKSAMKRNSAGEPSSPIGAALDRIAP